MSELPHYTTRYSPFRPQTNYIHTHLHTSLSGQTNYTSTRLHTSLLGQTITLTHLSILAIQNYTYHASPYSASGQTNYIDIRLQRRHTQTTDDITNTSMNYTTNGLTPPCEQHRHSSHETPITNYMIPQRFPTLNARH
jgi:hypothetical protein